MKNLILLVLLIISTVGVAQEANFEAVSYSVNRGGRGWTEPVPSYTTMYMDLENSLFIVGDEMFVVYGASTSVLEDGSDVILLSCLDPKMDKCEIWLNKFEGGGIGVFIFYPDITIGYTVIIVENE